jgi:hypothetical protein
MNGHTKLRGANQQASRHICIMLRALTPASIAPVDIPHLTICRSQAREPFLARKTRAQVLQNTTKQENGQLLRLNRHLESRNSKLFSYEPGN